MGDKKRIFFSKKKLFIDEYSTDFLGLKGLR